MTNAKKYFLNRHNKDINENQNTAGVLIEKNTNIRTIIKNY